MTESPVAKEADCLTSQHTKHSLKHQQSTNPESEPHLPRERFSPLAELRLMPLPEPVGQRQKLRAAGKGRLSTPSRP